MLKSIKLIFFLFCFTCSCIGQTFAGIEIGSKGIKTSIIDMQNIKRSVYIVRDSWTDNIGLAKFIAINGKLGPEEIEKAGQVVLKNYLRLKNEFAVEESKIFIVASSGVAMANNTADLSKKVKDLTKKDLDFITSKLEAKLLVKGGIPPKYYENSLILDIGGGNTKGGYVEEFNDENIVFYPLNLDYGTITLTETINKRISPVAKNIEYTDALFKYLPTLRENIQKMYNQNPNSHNKTNLYLSGGAVWAFYTLYFEQAAKENFSNFEYQDVVNHHYILQNNFRKYEQLALVNPDVDKVIKTYSQRHLLAANNILLTCIEEMKKNDTKKLYFVKQGQIAWLLAYIADSAKGSKVVF